MIDINAAISTLAGYEATTEATTVTPGTTTFVDAGSVQAALVSGYSAVINTHEYHRIDSDIASSPANIDRLVDMIKASNSTAVING